MKMYQPQVKKADQNDNNNQMEEYILRTGKKDHKTVLAFLAEERIKFSIFSRNICPNQHELSMLFFFFVLWERRTKLALRKEHNIDDQYTIQPLQICNAFLS
jgi:hypothetical protein